MATLRTDLFELNLIEAAADDATIVEFTGATAGGTGGNQGKSSETDFFIQGAECVSKNFNATGVGGYGYDAAASWTVPTDGANYIWTYWAAPNSVANRLNGGYQIHIGNTTANYRKFHVDGSDTQLYGGWRCYPVNYAQSANGTTGTDQGSPNGTNQVLGYAVNNLTSISKGNPFGMDAMRYGRGTIAMTSDVNSTTGSFQDIADYNDKNSAGAVSGFVLINSGSHRFGIFSLQNGVFQLQGRILLGSGSAPITTEAGGAQGTSAVTFLDSNVNIIIQESIFCSANFNAFEIQNTGSSITWTNVSVTSLAGQGNYPARGNFIVTDNATVDLNSCVFNDCGFFTFNGGTNPNTVDDSSFTSCGLITVAGATITNCKITDSVDANAAISVSPSELSNITGSTIETSSATGNAVDLGTITSSATATWNGNTLISPSDRWTGAVGSGVSTTANGAIKITATGGNAIVVDISAINNATVPSIETDVTGLTGGGTLTVNVLNIVSVTISGLLGNTEVSVLENPSPYSTAQGGASATTLFNTDVISAVTGTDIELDTGGGANITQILRTGTTDFTTMGLVNGDQVRVSQRSNLKIFDTYTVDGEPTASAINVTDVASSTSKLSAIIDSPGETVTVEKIDASYTFDVSLGQTIDFLAYRVGSLPITVLNQTITTTNNSFPLTQTVDRNFDAFEV